MKENTAVFIGHNEITGLNKSILEETIKRLIDSGITNFLSGGIGSFDRVSAGAVYKLKSNYPQIHNELIIPYLNFNIFDSKIFDEIIYLDKLEGIPYKAAIIIRNQHMISLAGTAVCFVNHNFGGAAKSREYAIKQGLRLIDLGSKKAAKT